MNLKKYIYGVALGVVAGAFTSCYNSDREFPDFEGGTTAYFAYQFPVRTLILGNDLYDNTIDNNHQCNIWATMGGAYDGRKAFVDFVVDPTLCDNLYFTDEGGNPAEPVLPMPTEYYKLLSNQIPYNGDMRGYVQVQFTDAFFNDPKAIENTYVIPLLMTNVTGIDHILVGKQSPDIDYVPSRTDVENWATLAKDYVLYCVKYMNPWQANYIRRGKDIVTQGDKTIENVRRDTKLVNSDPNSPYYKENPVNQNDEVCSIRTKNMTQAIFPVSIATPGNASRPCNLILTFNGTKPDGKCTISTEDEGITVEGEGEFITNGARQEAYKDFRWGNLKGQVVADRDILRLSYKINFGDMQSETTDTLVVQTRESNKKEFFSTLYIK